MGREGGRSSGSADPLSDPFLPLLFLLSLLLLRLLLSLLLLLLVLVSGTTCKRAFCISVTDHTQRHIDSCVVFVVLSELCEYDEWQWPLAKAKATHEADGVESAWKVFIAHFEASTISVRRPRHILITS